MKHLCIYNGTAMGSVQKVQMKYTKLSSLKNAYIKYL